MWYTVKQIYKWTNISDSGCQSKIDRFNDLLSSFSWEIFDLYPMKTIERFAPATCKSQLETKHPIAKVWWFYGKWCNVMCAINPQDCCAGYKRLLMEEMYWDNLDQNSYSIVWDNLVNMKLPEWLTDAFIVYSRWFEQVESMDDEVDMDRNILSLFRLYMKSEYAIENSDLNAWANYRSLFQTKLKRLKEMYDNNVKWIAPGSRNAANQ